MRRTLRILAGVAVASAALTGLTACDVAGGYVDKAKQVGGADNMEDQYKRVMTDFNALQTSADNACAAQAEAKKDDSDPTLVESPALAYAATYRKIWVDYNTRMNNIFEAQAVGPVGYPRHIPDYTGGSNRADFCVIGDKLVQLKADAETQ